MRVREQITTPPSLELGSLEAEVARLRHMVHVMAEMLVECGVVDQAMIEGRLRVARAAELPLPSRPSLWSRLFGGRHRPSLLGVGAVPSVIMPGDQTDRTVELQKLPFEVQSLYDEPGAPTSAESVKARG